MRETDGRKLDHQTLEALRIRAVKQVEDGVHPETVARAIGMNSATVYRWVAAHREGGLEALRAKPVPGRPPKLQGPQIARLYTLIVGTDPRQLQFEFALWTREMVREVIRREFDVRLSAVSVGRLLRKMGLSPQRPAWLATQQNPDAVEEFKTVIFPKIRAEAAASGGTVWFADEAGVRSDYHAGTTWAPVGKTPVVTSTGSRHSVNMISAVAPDGSLRFSTYTGRFTSTQFIDFCKRLLHDADGPVFLVVDGHPTHRVAQHTTNPDRPSRDSPDPWSRARPHRQSRARGRVPLLVYQRHRAQFLARRPATCDIAVCRVRGVSSWW